MIAVVSAVEFGNEFDFDEKCSFLNIRYSL